LHRHPKNYKKNYHSDLENGAKLSMNYFVLKLWATSNRMEIERVILWQDESPSEGA